MTSHYWTLTYSILSLLLSFANCQSVTRPPPADLDLLINEVQVRFVRVSKPFFLFSSVSIHLAGQTAAS